MSTTQFVLEEAGKSVTAVISGSRIVMLEDQAITQVLDSEDKVVATVYLKPGWFIADISSMVSR